MSKPHPHVTNGWNQLQIFQNYQKGFSIKIYNIDPLHSNPTSKTDFSNPFKQLILAYLGHLKRSWGPNPAFNRSMLRGRKTTKIGDLGHTHCRTPQNTFPGSCEFFVWATPWVITLFSWLHQTPIFLYTPWKPFISGFRTYNCWAQNLLFIEI